MTLELPSVREKNEHGTDTPLSDPNGGCSAYDQEARLCRPGDLHRTPEKSKEARQYLPGVELVGEGVAELPQRPMAEERKAGLTQVSPSKAEGGRDTTASARLDACMELLRQNELNGLGGGQNEFCAADGALVRQIFVDGVGRSTVEERLSADGATKAYTLPRENISFTVDNGHMLSYKHGDHEFRFDPKQQSAVSDRYPGLSFDYSKIAAIDYDKPVDVGGGLKASGWDGEAKYILPDGGPIVSLKQNRVVEIARGGKYDYKFTGLDLGKKDPYLPRDARLHDSVAIRSDANDAISVPKARHNGNFLQASEAGLRFSQHISEMPKDKRLEYVQEIQQKVADLEKNAGFLDRQRLSYRTAGDGSLRSVAIAGANPFGARVLWRNED